MRPVQNHLLLVLHYNLYMTITNYALLAMTVQKIEIT